ncbi:alpha/beta fold hydrolase [Modestobacter sp. VKM Ac-2978]|uniref:alpha/beta fold hydrolase n=1 Tax=Modestobacter sp. VKM Ac-2978 TaxID=3004132 RepID=UPI0022AAD4A4|nr:alpha/beta fold hydrolase [Modestobacter sp. VKM Ac-2978]MCZ2847960.1 alpha/beta fold hydrolase [Modestobacter sp. VKM Ac-2978]
MTSTFAESYAAAAGRWPAGATQTDVPTSWGRTHLLAAGPLDAPAVLLLHGGGATATAWADLAGELAGRCRLLAPDQPGDVGLSATSRPPRSSADLVSWLAELQTAVGCPRWHVVGHSAGAHLGLRAALAAPHRVATLTLLDPTAVVAGFRPGYLVRAVPSLVRPTQRRVRRFLDWETAGRALPEAWVDTHVRGALRDHGPLVRTRRPSAAELSALAVPTLVVVAGRSRAHDPDRVARRAAALPGTTVVRLADATHHTLPLLDAPDVAAAVEPHLRRG